jgi:Flp pilus assembly protein TadG
MLAFLNRIRGFNRDRRGNVAVIAAIAMPVLAGSLGIGAEVASWYGGKRALQNAADSAAIAAATNSSEDYLEEARAVAARYGFQNGVDGVTVTATDAAPCPAGGNDCYRVTVARSVRLLLAQAVGYHGDVTLDGAPAKLISATALAIQAMGPREYCVLALAGSGNLNGIRSNGAPEASLVGCNVMSNTNASCNGHDLDADVGDAHGTNDGCGNRRNSNVPVAADPYAALASNIPSASCGSGYNWSPSRRSDPALPSANHLHGAMSFSVKHVCGDAQLQGPTLITSPNSVLVIHGGGLDLQNYTIQTTAGASLTVIFTGPTFGGHSHIPFGTGMMDISSPTTGTWKGVALYQNPALTSGVDVDEAGNAPAWNISGLVYLPKANVEWSGIINKASYGASCFVLVVDNVRIDGTAQILAHDECAIQGTTMPSSAVPSRGQLVS